VCVKRYKHMCQASRTTKTGPSWSQPPTSTSVCTSSCMPRALVSCLRHISRPLGMSFLSSTSVTKCRQSLPDRAMCSERLTATWRGGDERIG
jgi:hypothetical protein